MRFVFIGCTHHEDYLLSVPDGDVLICTGDFSSTFGTRYDVDRFNALLGRLPHKYKFVVFGDRDEWCDANETEAISRLYNAKVLVDETVEVEGFKIFGTPWSPWSFSREFSLAGAFCDHDDYMIHRWCHIPEGLDILITHCPPEFGGLAEIVRQRAPRLHVFSHGNGKQHYARTKALNVTQMDRFGNVVGKPVVMDL
ncbi:MAG: hypothetical protein WC505_07020 [Patescibacteria group bacterium]